LTYLANDGEAIIAEKVLLETLQDTQDCGENIRNNDGVTASQNNNTRLELDDAVNLAKDLPTRRRFVFSLRSLTTGLQDLCGSVAE